MAQPTHKATSATIYAVATGSTGFTITMPSAAADYDIVLVLLWCGAGSSTFVCGSGYTSLGKVTGTDIVTELFYKRVMSGEGNIACTSTGDNFYGFATMYTGCVRTGNPTKHLLTEGPTSSTTCTSDNITPTIADTRILCFVAIEDNNARSGYPPTNWSGRFDDGSNTGTDGSGVLAEYSLNLTAGTQLNSLTIVSQNAADYWVVYTLALVPQYITGPQQLQGKKYLFA